jgi:hypothetical protein
VQHAGDNVHVTEIMDLHSFIARPFDPIGPGYAPDHIAPIHNYCVLRIDEIRSEQPLERLRIPAYQGCRPLIFEFDRRQ